ncbi:MAG: hypothetical protein KatS3mg043_0150 [Rhodothermaceae bacterium]|nr:MAG: hypothetical protein KatS3mg043_0150 [Rhodothermaceae bacterium]
MNVRKSVVWLLLLVLAGNGTGCDLVDIEDRPDPNGPSLEGVLRNPTRAQIENLAVGVEASARLELQTYFVDVGMIGREVYRFSSADPRFTGDLLGKGTSVLDNNTFYITRPWGARYRTIRNANILIEAADLSTALSAEEKRAVKGFAGTFIAHQLLMNLNLTFRNGIRVDVAGEEPGPVAGYDEALAQIAAMLDAANGDLGAGGSVFPFPLSGGFAGFNTPPTFRQFNRALAARVAAYRQDWAGVLNLLQGSFLDVNAPLTRGVYHSFSTAPGDLANPLAFNPNAPAGDAYVAHPSYANDIRPGDTRIAKVLLRDEPASLDGLTSNYGIVTYPAADSPIPIIRNAELILLRAEARIQTGDLAGAVADLNVIRQAAGLGPYDGAMTRDALLDEMLYQRRYELFNEGHRWVDMRRYGRLNQLPIDRAGDDVWEQFPIPRTENV